MENFEAPILKAWVFVVDEGMVTEIIHGLPTPVAVDATFVSRALAAVNKYVFLWLRAIGRWLYARSAVGSTRDRPAVGEARRGDRPLALHAIGRP